MAIEPEAQRLLQALTARAATDKEGVAAAVQRRIAAERAEAEIAARRVLNDLEEKIASGKPPDEYVLLTMSGVEKESGSEKIRLLRALECLLGVELESRLAEVKIPAEDVTPWDESPYYYTLRFTRAGLLALLGEQPS